jgi:hypothetical protein
MAEWQVQVAPEVMMQHWAMQTFLSRLVVTSRQLIALNTW